MPAVPVARLAYSGAGRSSIELADFVVENIVLNRAFNSGRVLTSGVHRVDVACNEAEASAKAEDTV